MSVSKHRPTTTTPAAAIAAGDDGSGDRDQAAARELDRQCIDRAIAGDRGAFDDLVLRYAPRLTRMAYALCGNVEDAEDLAQEALAKAYFKLESFAGRSSFFTWVYRITVNLSISKRRKRRIESTHRAVPIDDAPTPATPETAEQKLSTEEEVARLRLAIDRLEEERRTVLVLRDMEGLDYDVISQVLEIPKGTVRSRLHRARNDLREMLSVPFMPNFVTETNE